MKKILSLGYSILLLTLSFGSTGQDTLTINEVSLSSSLVKQSLLRTTTAAAIIDSTQLKLQTINSLVPAFNALPGIRMEERSPGSYRLSIRGSLLRSPFGIRNVKVYFDEYPLTDAGGNTYINVIAMNAISKTEILKGPDGSLFGANSGGAVIIQPNNEKEKLTAEAAGGSYGLFKQDISFAKHFSKSVLNITESYQRSDGYRDNSKLHRLYLQANEKWQYSSKNYLKALLFYSDLFYQTPGGLTLNQYDSTPSQSRPPTATLPGAVTQKAAVYNKMFFAGLTNHCAINKYIQNNTSLFVSSVHFKNPFITNYEVRNENTYGARTFFTLSNDFLSAKKVQYQYIIGAEWQQTKSSISNYKNDHGSKTVLMAKGNVLTDQHFIFTRLRVDINKKLVIEPGVSLNYYSYRFTDSSSLHSDFNPQWMPRFAINYSPLKRLSIRSAISKGYSTPTTAEIRPADSVYKKLQAETGINTELGLRYFSARNKFSIDIAIYHYELKNAIVLQQDAVGNNYFINAGKTKQNGLETQLSWTVLEKKQSNSILKKLQVNNSNTLNHYRFRDYTSGTHNYSGNKITGIAEQNFVSSILLELKSFYLFTQHNFTSKIPLNDANTVFAKAYHLIQVKAGHIFNMKSMKLEIYAGIDNLLNQHYSLGNDLNATGNRFFNAAPLRNYFGGMLITR